MAWIQANPCQPYLSQRPHLFGGTDATSSLSNTYNTKQYTYAPKEQVEQEEEVLDNADAQLSDGTELISPYGYYDYDWIGTHDVGIDFTNTDFNQSLAEVMVDDPDWVFCTDRGKVLGGVPRAWDRNPPRFVPEISGTLLLYHTKKQKLSLK